MKWDRDYVRGKYEFHILGQKGVFFPCDKAKRLIVFFSSMGKDRYDRYSWFWEEIEAWENTAYLFLKDDSFRYFLGDDKEPLEQTFRKIIQHHMDIAKVDYNQVFTVGGSMGGYAAIYYASFLGLNGAVVANPQVDYQSTRCHSFQNWERQIRSMGHQWYDLEQYICKKKIPKIYIEYGNYMADKRAAEKLIDVLGKSDSLFIVRKTLWDEHTVDCLKKDTIESAISFFERNDFYW